MCAEAGRGQWELSAFEQHNIRKKALEQVPVTSHSNNLSLVGGTALRARCGLTRLFFVLHYGVCIALIPASFINQKHDPKTVDGTTTVEKSITRNKYDRNEDGGSVT